jgi:hypothetical protein
MDGCVHCKASGAHGTLMNAIRILGIQISV